MRGTAWHLWSAVVLALPLIAFAQKRVVQGLGMHTCGEAMQKIDKYGTAVENNYTDWVQGYITGRNSERSLSRPRANAVVSNDVSADTIAASVKNKCRQDALKYIVFVAEEIYKDLEKQAR